jgi:hypothetical protein
MEIHSALDAGGRIVKMSIIAELDSVPGSSQMGNVGQAVWGIPGLPGGACDTAPRPLFRLQWEPR